MAPAAKSITLDAEALARLKELDPGGKNKVVTRVMGAFETSLQRLMDQLAAQASGGDAAVVKSVAHTLKSSAASVGAKELARLCAEVERRLRDGAPGNMDDEVQAILHEGQAALRAVRDMLHA